MKLIRKGREKKIRQWKFGSFDIETKGLNTSNFLFGVCAWNEKNKSGDLVIKKKVFYSKEEMVDFMISRKFKQYHWWGHNAGGYDMLALFGNYLLDPNFNVVFNGSRFIVGEYIKDGYKIYFHDSVNIFPVKLEQLGKDLFHYKGETPDKFKVSRDDEKLIRDNINSGKWTIKDVMNIYGIKAESVARILEVGELGTTITQEDINYCIRDAEIVLRAINSFADFLMDRWQVSMRSTIASISQNVFLTKYIDNDLRVSGYDKFFRNSYYGGRTELFDRKGEWLTDVYYYDFNSLYPSVMHDFWYPDPENLKYVNFSNESYIFEYEGTSFVDVYVPEHMEIPPLPYKWKGKLIFPTGHLNGWYNHNELRMAVKYGARIEKVHKTVYSTRNINPFRNFIEDLYNMRLKFKDEGNKTGNLYTKLIMNSLYGKFGQRIVYSKMGWIDEPPEIPKHLEGKGYEWTFESIGKHDFGTWKLIDSKGQVLEEDAYRSILSFSSYITSWARIKLYEKMMEVINDGYEVYYCDTDSIITNHPNLENSKELGKLKLEGVGDFSGYAPKVYEWKEKGEDKIKIKLKGVRNPDEIKNEYVERRIIKPKEALRRHEEAGKGEFKKKIVTYVDTKRFWNGNRGQPWNVDTLIVKDEKEKWIRERIQQYYKELKKHRQVYIYYDEDDERYKRTKSMINSDYLVQIFGHIPTKEELRDYFEWEFEQLNNS